MQALAEMIHRIASVIVIVVFMFAVNFYYRATHWKDRLFQEAQSQESTITLYRDGQPVLDDIDRTPGPDGFATIDHGKGW